MTGAPLGVLGASRERARDGEAAGGRCRQAPPAQATVLSTVQLTGGAPSRLEEQVKRVSDRGKRTSRDESKLHANYAFFG